MTERTAKIFVIPGPEGRINGFIDTGFTPEIIVPDIAIEISGEQWIEMKASQANWKLNSETKSFEPFTPPPPAKPTTISAREFLNRFSDEEEALIAEASMQNPAILLWFMRLNSNRRSVDLISPQTAIEIQALVTAGVISEERMEEVLA